MAFAAEIQRFSKKHPFAEEKIDGISTRYLLCGKADARYTLVYLVGGTGISDVWSNHIIPMEEDYRILTFDYPMEIDTLEQLADHIVKLMKVVPYSWIKKMLFAVSKKRVGMENENPIDRAYLEDFFAWVYGHYTKKFDLHMTGLIIDVAGIKPFELSDYEQFDHKALLVLPEADKAFSEAAQADLLHSMPKAKVVRVKGGHTAVLYKVDEYVRQTREFLETCCPCLALEPLKWHLSNGTAFTTSFTPIS